MKMETVFRERKSLALFLKENPLASLTDSQKWSAMTTIATVVHNIYHGLEEVMKVVCGNVDGHVPEGASSH